MSRNYVEPLIRRCDGRGPSVLRVLLDSAPLQWRESTKQPEEMQISKSSAGHQHVEVACNMNSSLVSEAEDADLK